ncbi:hypothetical protein DL767_008366 [Monosporascus sp. MG133]|nr:hypothetical protein DL767_008366 [Monosporascus sp. MG133]
MCGSFLTIQGGYVYLIHQSVKDYLSGKASSIIFPSGPADVHHAIFSRSLETMSTLRRNIYGLHHLGPIGEVKTPEPDPLAAGHEEWVSSVAFSHDSKLLASGSDDRTIKIWDAATGSLQQTLEGHSNIVSSVTFSHDSKLLASGSYDGTIKIWDAATGSLQQTLKGHSNIVSSVAFSYDSKLLASGSYDGTIKIWDAATGSLQQTLDLGIKLLGQKKSNRYLELRIRTKLRKHNTMATP